MNKIEVVFRYEQQIARLVNPPQVAIDVVRGLSALDMAYVLRKLAEHNVAPDTARTRGDAYHYHGAVKLKISSTLIWN